MAKISVCVHTFTEDYVPTPQITPPSSFDTELPINEIIIGAVDGQTWVGANGADPVYQAIYGPEPLERFSKSMEKVNIHVRSGIVVRGADPVAEAEEAAKAVRITGDAIVNLEAGFLRGPQQNVKTFFEHLRELCPNEKIGTTADHTNKTQVQLVAPYVDTMWQVLYFGAGTADALDVPISMVEAYIAAVAIGFANFAPTKPFGLFLWAADNDPARFLFTLRNANSYGAEISLFRRMIWSARNIDVVRDWKR